MRRALKEATFAIMLIAGLSAPAAGEEIHVTQWGVSMPGVVHAVALEKGFYKEAGADITGIISSSGGGTGVRNLFGGGLQYAEVGPAAAINAFNSGLNVHIVNFSVTTASDYLWITMPDSKINSLKDAVGARIAVTQPKSSTEMMSVLALERENIKPDQVKFVYAGGVGASLTALEGGAADITILVEPFASMRPGRYKIIARGAQVLPPVVHTVGVATKEFMTSDPAKLRAIIAGRRKAVDFIYANPAEASDIFAKYYTNLTKEQATLAINTLIPLNYWSRGAINLNALKELARGLQMVGALEDASKLRWDQIVDQSFLPADQRQ